MYREGLVDLADCTLFRQTVAARPPRIVHGTTFLLTALLAAAIAWSALVQADLVVRMTGRVRASEIPTKIFTAASGEVEGRVVEARFKEGDVVHRGDVLVRLDAARIDNQIGKLERTIESAEDEMEKLNSLESLLALQLNAAKDKAQAELTQAEATLLRAESQRASEIRRNQAEVKSAEDYLRRCRKLRESSAATEQELLKAETNLSQAQEKLVQAELPSDGAQVAIARRAVELVDRDFAVRRAEIESRAIVKRGEAEAARKELANLHLHRDETVLRSPLDGVVVAGHVQPGDVLRAGTPALEIAPLDGYRFEALVPSEDVGDLRTGMPVHIKFDAYDYQKYGVLDGTVTYLSPDSQVAEMKDRASEGTENTKASTAPAAFLVRVELSSHEVGRGELRGRVKLGLGGTAEIVTGRESILVILLKRIRRTISLG